MKKVKITFKKLTAKHLIFIQIIYNCFIRWCTGELGLPSNLNYVTDVITAALFVEIMFYEIKQTNRVRRTPVFYIIVIFFVYTLINWLMHLYSPIYYFWGLRNVFRFYVFLIACTMFLEKDDIDKIFNLLFVIFVINIAMGAYQYFVLGKRRDFIAGFLGGTETQGGNGPMIVICCLACIITVVKYIEKHGGVLKPAMAILGTLFIATIAELKVLYVFVIVIIAFSSLFTRFSFKKLVLITILLAAIPIALEFLYELYPNFDNFFDLETITEYSSSGYGGNEDGIDRFTAFSYCFENFLETPLERIFGMGLGAADGSTNVKAITTSFYEKNYDTHYMWFAMPHILIENGVLGLIMYWGICLIPFCNATKLRKARNIRRDHVIIAQIIPIFMIFFSIYNYTMRVEVVGYTCYALLSIPYVLSKGYTIKKIR